MWSPEEVRMLAREALRAPWDINDPTDFSGAQSDHRSLLTMAPAWDQGASGPQEPFLPLLSARTTRIGDLFSSC